MTNGEAPSWVFLAETVRGASHVRSGDPNQDACSFKSAEDGLTVAVAVADGHGSTRSFRSSEGASFAAQAAVDAAIELIKGSHEQPVASTLDLLKRHLPAEILRRWRQAVVAHILDNPITSIEESAVPPPLDQVKTFVAGTAQYVPYGTTLLLVLATAEFVFYLQIGDGDIVVVPAQSNDGLRPVPNDSTLIANETASLCLPDAMKFFRTTARVVAGSAPQMIMMSTDGYCNAFSSDTDFLQVATDLVDIARSKGISFIEDQLATWLADASAEGSGDDVTLALLFHGNAFPLTISPPAQ